MDEKNSVTGVDIEKDADPKYSGEVSESVAVSNTPLQRQLKNRHIAMIR